MWEFVLSLTITGTGNYLMHNFLLVICVESFRSNEIDRPDDNVNDQSNKLETCTSFAQMSIQIQTIQKKRRKKMCENSENGLALTDCVPIDVV